MVGDPTGCGIDPGAQNCNKIEISLWEFYWILHKKNKFELIRPGEGFEPVTFVRLKRFMINKGCNAKQQQHKTNTANLRYATIFSLLHMGHLSRVLQASSNHNTLRKPHLPKPNNNCKLSLFRVCSAFMHFLSFLTLIIYIHRPKHSA